MTTNNYPKLHNSLWPGVVGKGPGSEPVIPFQQLLELTANTACNGIKFDGVDIGLFDPDIEKDNSDDGIKRMAEKVAAFQLNIGSLVASIWPPAGGSAMGSSEERKRFIAAVKKACHIGKLLRELGIRPYGIIRIDSASTVQDWLKDPVMNTQLIASTFSEACDIAADYGEKLAAEGEICWGGMHSWKTMLDTLEAVNRKNFGFQADMSHTLLYLMGYNSPEHKLLPDHFNWNNRSALTTALKDLTNKLRPWTIDFHVAQNDGSVHGSGTHDKTGRHCLPNDPNGKLDIAHDAGFWLRNDSGELTKSFKHICWDGCMFPNETLLQPQTWKDILKVMIEVRELHGWYEAE